MAAIGAGLVPPETNWARAGTTVIPDPAVRPLYDELFAQYTALYPATRDQVHALAVIQERGAPDR
jgi:xylulokinase